ncbi:DUF389 domain-containing protein [Lysobacter hankyongensis]|uniref:TIGR00341 family protein n=1 Tax=Lysobacter hankyongensis TaxID=1176535 RepID=A0ABP9BLV4_9GAMM
MKTEPHAEPRRDPPSSSTRLRRAMAVRFSLLADKADDAVIERRIREGVALQGATPWILMFAIFIASIGLNVNSTAVIIGAMLISPLMGPIMGVGLGAAVYDFALIRTSLWNLAIASAISLGVSTLYFLVTPLAEAQSELLARTSPTLWDVLIALFGGLAGIVGITREEKSNVIPGVAIATALMPPLCTAGYGLATGQWQYFGGAFYLYSINCVFIALATVIGIRLVRVPVHASVDSTVERRLRNGLLMLALATALPSAWLAYRLVQQEVFKSRAIAFVRDEFAFDRAHVADTRVDPATRAIEVSLIGLPLDRPTLQRIEGKLATAGLPGAKMLVHQAGENDRIDVTALKSSLLSDLYRDSQDALQKKDAELAALRDRLAAREALLNQTDAIAAELRALLPATTSVTLSQGYRIADGAETSPVVQLIVQSSDDIDEADRDRIVAWFKARAGTDAVAVVFDRPQD